MHDVPDKSFSASLLPYLNGTKGASHLRFSLVSYDTTVLESLAFPFVTLNDTDALARMIEAQFVTDTGDLLKKVFVLVQKDQYLLKENEVWPITNPDVENAWRNAFSFYTSGDKDQRMVALSSQLDDAGVLVPFASLFFCKTRRIFFHPPCPKCGLPLRQCTDDHLLVNAGLQPHSHSLRRYLSCRSCDPRSASHFYTYELDPFDPPGLKDRWTLVKEFDKLVGGGPSASEFPCFECISRDQCYGLSGMASSRIVPFSFYPFYVLIFDAMSLHALDFLSLLSGATHEELEAGLAARREEGRVACLKALHNSGSLTTPFLHRGDERFFLEALYLKLTFLTQLAQSMLSASPLVHPSFSLSLDRVWVKLSGQSSLLPSFWNFRAQPIDISRSLADSEFTSTAVSRPSVYYLGMIWLYALLVSKKQDMRTVLRAIKEQLHGGSSGATLTERSGPVFSSGNIFWEPDGKEIPEGWRSLWDKALVLGWPLLMVGVQVDRAWSKEGFVQQLEDLREEVKRTLFQWAPAAPAQPHAVEQSASSSDTAIHAVLKEILVTWQTKAAEAAETKIEVAKEEKEGLMETVILRAADLDKEFPRTPKQTEAELQETVILSTQTAKKKIPAPTEIRKADETWVEAVPIPAAGTGAQAPLDVESREPDKKKIKKPEEEFAAETVILTVKRKDK